MARSIRPRRASRTSATPASPIGRALSSLTVERYPQLLLSGFLWNLTRWLGIFLGSYLINERTGSPLAVQLVGTAFFLPMFVGGLVAGVVSDRFDRRTTLLRNLAGLAPLSLLMAVIVASGSWHPGVIYLFIFAVGIGGVLDMTNRRALVYDLVGPEHITNAVALEMFSAALGNMIGFLSGGILLDFFGDAWAFGLMAVCYTASFLTLRAVGPIARVGGATAVEVPSLVQGLVDGARMVRANARLRSILGVTVFLNFFMFSFLPMVPIFAEDLDLSPFATGLMGSAVGTGMMIGSLLVAGPLNGHRGRIYVGGSFLAMVCLLGLPLATGLIVAYPAVLFAGLGAGLFGATQSALVMSVATDENRGRAMGSMAMAIGSLPFGIFSLGVFAELVGPSTALLSALSTGFVLLTIWLIRRPEVRHIS